MYSRRNNTQRLDSTRPCRLDGKGSGRQLNIARQLLGALPSLVGAVRHAKRLGRVLLALVPSFAPRFQLRSVHACLNGSVQATHYTPKWPFIRVLAREHSANLALVREIWPPAGTYALRFSRWSAV